MVEVMRFSSQGQYPSDAMDLSMMEMSSRLMNTTLGSFQGELKKGLPKDEGQHVAPRRAFTTSNYLLPTPPTSNTATPAVSPRESIDRDSYFQPPVTHLTPPISPYLSPSGTLHRLPQPAPPRSYSVMDYEPIPFTHQPGTTLQLSHLPAELHYALFEFLDPIDSVCLALTSRHFYAVHWNMHGKVSLAARREGPNDMEWVWHHAGPFLLNRNGAAKQNSLALLSPRGQVYCRKCRTARCELHKHIKEWMGEGFEYCVVTEKFGPSARQDAKGFCYRSSPRHPNRCGRHTQNQRTVRLA
ncbi:hypothetical protein E0Z10_g1764 [Xylaria hypoxylon]|uniref:F-box domain-containing protein n=1 Tax=Xylaria hypoxylon TaxID=37992 RepID=A0A4Z0ZE34_9PEZI|nr:hypothetical protein E0Z10_g1764 [Xylaria hypoxylon]